MTDVFSPKKRALLMSKIRSKNTKPELMVRSFLHRHGYRYGLHSQNLPGRPDIVLNKYRTIIQVKGCFWHGHKCAVSHIPKSNKYYWVKKIKGNSDRDRKNERRLRGMGWSVLTIWECQCRKKEIFRITSNRIINLLNKRK